MRLTPQSEKFSLCRGGGVILMPQSLWSSWQPPSQLQASRSLPTNQPTKSTLSFHPPRPFIYFPLSLPRSISLSRSPSLHQSVMSVYFLPLCLLSCVVFVLDLTLSELVRPPSISWHETHIDTHTHTHTHTQTHTPHTQVLTHTVYILTDTQTDRQIHHLHCIAGFSGNIHTHTDLYFAIISTFSSKACYTF